MHSEDQFQEASGSDIGMGSFIFLLFISKIT